MKAKNLPRPIRYLLSADRRLQKISLKRIPEPLKKATQSPRSIRLKHSGGAGSFKRFRWATSLQAVVLGVICAVAAAAVITVRQPSRGAAAASVDAPPELNAQTLNAPAAAPLEMRKTVVSMMPATAAVANALVSKAPAAAAAAKTYTAEVSMGKTPAVESVKAPAVESSAKTPAVESAPIVVAVESTAKADVQSVAPVTITGCLGLDEETFWLKETTGVDAPKSRSWRSGFLKKRPSRIELVDATNTLKLTNYVGQRVAATGMFMNREMQARSLRLVAASCNGRELK